MIFCLIVSTSALGATQVFSGKIVSTDSIDLSDVEIKIYSSERTYDENGKFLYYVETYERSVYADADGDFEFVKPSLYCSYTINVETLPVNYGVSKHTQFIIPTRTSDSVTIAAIATAEADYSGGSFYAVFKAANGTEIYTDHDIIEDGGDSVLKTSGNLSASKDIKDIDSYTLSGTIVTKGKNYRYSKNFSISDYSEIEKADLLCSLGKITKEERHNIYSQYGDEFSIYEYNCCIEENSRATTAYQDPESDQFFNVALGNNTVIVKYTESSFTNCPEKLDSFEDTLEDVYNYFCVDNGFLIPVAPAGNFCIHITSETGENGRTYHAETGPGSTIWIKESLVQNGNARRTLAHEFMHAIMYRYLVRNTGDWFHESFATMASLVYLYEEHSNELDSESEFEPFSDFLQAYVNKTVLSLTSDYSNNFNNGTLGFALCIYQNHGGWPTIRAMFEDYDNTSPVFDSIYGTYSGTTFNYESIFDEMSMAILFPFHSTLGFDIAQDYFIMDYWPSVQCPQRSIPSNMENRTILPLSIHYYDYTSSSNIGTVYVTAESTGDCLFNLFKYTSANTFTHRFSDEVRIVFEITNFGSNSANNRFILTVTNFSISTTRSFSISVQQ